MNHMPEAYIVTPEIVSKFKEPFGTLIPGTPAQTMAKLKEIVQKENPPMIISVGDTVSRNLHKYSIIPHLSITDNQSLRRKIKPKVFDDKALVKIKNPQGTITPEAIAAIEAAIKSAEAIQLLVEGEEDLLTLIVARYAPENALVIYGQPHLGIVVVKITSEKKADADKIWREMKRTKEEK